MNKWLIVLVVLVVGFTLIFLSLEHFGLVFKKELKTLTDQKKSGEYLGEKVENFSQDLILDTKNSAQEDVQRIADGVNQILEKATSAILGERQKKNLVEISLVQTQTEANLQNLTTVDFLSERDLKVKVQKNTVSYFGFKNVPLGFCLFLNDEKYPVEEGKVVSIKFLERGSYQISADFCDLANKSLGEVVVE